MRYIDLRSDTVTQPTQEMRNAMFKAVVGDDFFDDDPTVKELEALAAGMFGKEAALFVTSGTQGNAVSVMAHTRRGDAIILGRGCHIASHEMGSYAALAGVSPVFAEDADGILEPESVKALIRKEHNFGDARTGLICVENALSNGNVASVENMAEIYRLARESKIPVHLDGARIFNAAHYLGADVKELTKHSDSVMCCLSKGLCAPVGSVVAGSREFIAEAKRIRKILGGGMRQAGFLAAAGIVALTKMTARLTEDHDNAKYLASRLASLPGVSIDEKSVKINMIFFTVDWSDGIIQSIQNEMLKHGVKIIGGSREFRFVTNNDVTRYDCDAVIGAMEKIVRK